MYICIVHVKYVYENVKFFYAIEMLVSGETKALYSLQRFPNCPIL